MELKVGEIIRAKRNEQKMSLQTLADKVGISIGYLSQIENGRKKNPKLEIILQLINELDLDMPMLLGLDPTEETYLNKIPSLLKMVFARERNIQVLQDVDIQRKFCSISEKLLESRYLIADKELYSLFLEDVRMQTDGALKRYLALKLIVDSRNPKE